MTVRRLGIGWVDDERSCINCGMTAPAEPWQHEWPEQVARYRQQADIVMNVRRRATVIAGPKELLRRASELDAKTKAASKEPFPAWLCAACRSHLHDPDLAAVWASGRHDAGDTALIERTIAYLNQLDSAGKFVHRPGATGSCLVCQSGSKYVEVPV